MLHPRRLIALARKVVPNRTALPEALGFALVGTGLFGFLALLSYNPGGSGVDGETYQNLAGPLGAWLADLMLRNIGIVGLVWCAGLVVCGAMMALGFVRWPRARWLVGLGLLTFVLAALATIQLPDANLVGQPNGPGGAVGAVIGAALLRSVGYGGSIIVLGLAAAAMLVLTGNLALSRTAYLLEHGVHRLRRLWARPRTKPFAGAAPPEPSAVRPSGSTAAAPSAPKEPTLVPPPASPDAPAAGIMDFSSSVPRHPRPDRKIFKVGRRVARKAQDFTKLCAYLEEQLRDFKVEGTMTDVTEGPVVTTMEFEPAPGTKTSKIVGLGDDLARLLAARSLRVLAPIPGKKTVGFEVPNRTRRTIRFGTVLKDFDEQAKGMALPIVMGVDTFGQPMIADLAEMPHLLVAGSTGSGKSVFMNTLIVSLIYQNSARNLRLVLIDPKMIELAAYERLPHLACPVVTDLAAHGILILDGLVAEMEDRYRRLGAVGARNIGAFNEIVRGGRRTQFPTYEGAWQTMPYVVLLVDEFADLVLTLGKEAEKAVTRLAQKARAAGIHLVIATQRPSVDVVTGLIKANFPTRIAFRVQSGVDSRTILDQIGAETLLGKGDMLFQSASGIRRLHAPFLEDTEVTGIVQACAA